MYVYVFVQLGDLFLYLLACVCAGNGSKPVLTEAMLDSHMRRLAKKAQETTRQRHPKQVAKKAQETTYQRRPKQVAQKAQQDQTGK